MKYWSKKTRAFCRAGTQLAAVAVLGAAFVFTSSNVKGASSDADSLEAELDAGPAKMPAEKSAAKPKLKKKAHKNKDSLEAELEAAPTPDPYKPEVKKAHRPIAELRTAMAKDDKNLDTRIELAEALQEKSDYAGMIEVLRPAADHLPRRGMLLLARGYGGNGEPLNEIRVMELVIAANPKDYYAQNLTGEAYSRLKKHDEAIERFSEAKKLNPQFEPAYVDLLAEYKKSGESYEGLELLGDMVKIFGEKPAYLNQLCAIYATQAYVDKALETCPKAMELDHKTPENDEYYAQALVEHEQPDQAQKVRETAARKFPQTESAQWEAGKSLFEKKNYLASRVYFDQCVKADAKSARCWLHLAKSNYELQKNQEAIDAFAKACGLNRSYTGEVRKAAAALRQKKDDTWPMKYEVVINRCSAITGSGD